MGDIFEFNAITGKLDLVSSVTDLDGRYLKLDQTTDQHVINGLPQFDNGITIKKDQRVYLDGQ